MRSVSPRHAVVGVVAVLYCSIALVFALHIGTPDQLKRVSGLSLTVAALAAGVACTLRGRTVPDPRTRTAWGLLGAAAMAWGLGQVVTLSYEVVLGEEVPFPSLADLGYLLTVPLFGAGLLFLTGPAGHLAARWRAVADGLLISCAVLLVSWVSVLGPVAHSSQDSLLSKIILIAYPAGDVALVTLAGYVLLRVRATGVRPTVPLGAIVAAVGGWAVADSGYAYLSLVGAYNSGSVIDAGWLGGFAVLFLAATFPPRAEEETAETRPLGMLMPYVFIVAAVVFSVVMTEVRGRGDDVSMWLRTLLILLMVVRQVLTLQEVSKLTRTLERRVEERTSELGLSQQRFRAMVEHSSDVVSLVGTDGAIRYVSDSSPRVFGHHAQALLGTHFGELLDDASRARLATTTAEVAQQPLRAAVVELRLLHGDGGWRQVETTVTNLLAEPAVNALVLNSRDVSERRQLENQLTHQAFHDPLTGLANRALFSDRVQHAVRRRSSGGGTVAVLFLDLDGFKEVNDSLGHASGDALLVAVAERVTSCVGPGDTIARLGGDEFAVLVEDATSAGEVLECATRIRQSLAAAIEVGGHDLFVAASIGMASAGPDTDDADQLIRNADLAMYQAKERRDGEPVIYDPSMHASLLERLQLEADLRAAIRENRLHVHYQPTFTLDTGDLVAVEALVRWTHPERGDVPPADFIPVAEQTGLIHDLGRFVLREACVQAQQWRLLAPGRPIAVAVNISGRQMQRAGFHEEVREVLEEIGLPAEHLVLEMTESILMDDTDASLRTLQALKSLGIRIAIDDFGTGYSSLSYLHKFPVDILKIDRSFVERLSAQNGQESLVHSIVQLGQTLQLETIAEGIEDHRQLLALRRLGADMAQGYHFGRPGPAELVTQQLVERVTEAPRVPGPREPEAPSPASIMHGLEAPAAER